MLIQVLSVFCRIIQSYAYADLSKFHIAGNGTMYASRQGLPVDRPVQTAAHKHV